MPEFHAVAPNVSQLAAPLMMVAGWAALIVVVALLATWFAFM